ncbi:MAG TPA: serine/threonine-protein kinase [Solirubrobacteraceae bacterium]|nr:serine/threonine-protein kinase [Solirubrobacteraceae bacterium]
MPPVSPARISLPDRYRVVRHIASGGMAAVWEAEDEVLGRSVAVKVLAGHLSEDERARRRFEREARAAAGLSSHQHVVTIYDVGEHDGRAFIVMELMRGGTVGERLKAGRAVADDTALRWLREAASALDAAHDAGVVHRDIKPGNLLLDDNDRLAIADFGIARLAMEDQLTATGQVLGTASYISPEQAMGDAATPASDRYALAVVAYELLTGTKPFQAEHFAAQARAHVEDHPPAATERDPSLPRGVDAVLDRGMAKEPSERWESAAAMVEALDQAMGATRPATEPTRPLAPVAAAAPRDGDRGAAPPPPPPPAHRGGRGGSGAILLAGLAGLLLIAVLGFVLLSGGDNGRSDGDNASEKPQASSTPRKREKTPTPTPTAERTATPTPTPTPTPTATETPPPGPAEPNLTRASQLQLQGYNARRAGDYNGALNASSQALKACGDAHALDPCGYALYEVGAALNGLGRYDEAIPYLERRLSEYGDNSSGEVQKALDEARAGGKPGKGPKDKGPGKD